MTPEQAQEKYHWIKYDKATNTVEMYLDNYLLSNSRICEGMFYLEHLLWIEPKYQTDGTTVQVGTETKYIRKPWFFDFGEYIHWCLEQYYKYIKLNSRPPVISEWLINCEAKWKAMRMDEYANSISESDVKKYEEVKGWQGVAGLLTQYYAYYWDIRLRIIDTEITFGYNKEVLIGCFEIIIGNNPCDFNPRPLIIYCYLTGRIDLLVDNGNKIGPVDHKTTHKFDGYEHEDFNPHDGICGYILAMHDILKKYQAEGLTQIPQCNGGWIYHISSCSPGQPIDKSKKPGPRFKTTPVDKNDEQLEDYKARQLSTFKRIAELLFNNKTPEWNTSACNYMFFRKCKYKPIHEQPSSQWPKIINDFYQIGKPWDTREHSSKEEKEETSKP